MAQPVLRIEGAEIILPPNTTLRFEGDWPSVDPESSVSYNYIRQDGEPGEIVIRPATVEQADG